MRNTFKGLVTLVKQNCKDCNLTLDIDCQGHSCKLYPYFLAKLLTPKSTSVRKNENSK